MIIAWILFVAGVFIQIILWLHFIEECISKKPIEARGLELLISLLVIAFTAQYIWG